MLPTHGSKDISLTRGLARNTIFNLIGWVWPIGLSIVSIPYIVTKLGNDSFGIFSVVSIVAGYLGLLNGPLATGNVRFMAEAYANCKWLELREAAFAGVVINGVLSLLGGLLMFAAADVLVRTVFSIQPEWAQSAVIAFRLAALSFILNGLVGALESIPIAMRRFDITNQIGLGVGTLNTVAIVLALRWGWGLLGAVMAQVFSSTLGLILFSIMALLLFRKVPGSGRGAFVGLGFVKRLASFSSLLFVVQVVSQVGLQIDRTVVGILLGTAALTFYTVPTRITDKVPGMMYVFSAALYPLSSEAQATDKMDELQHLYHETVRILLWISAFIATPLLILSKEILNLWIGPEFMVNSWLVLALLAAGVVWRSSGSVAYQVCNGMGRADVNLIASIGTAVFMALPVIFLAPKWGAPGAALGVFVGLLASNVAYDLFVQRRLLGCKSWKETLAPYVRVTLAVVATAASARLLPFGITGWVGLIMGTGLISLIYVALSLGVGALRIDDINFVTGGLRSILKRAPSTGLPVAPR